MWVVGLSRAGVSTGHPALHAAAAARRLRGHRVLCLSFRDALGFVRPEPLSTRMCSSSGASLEIPSKTAPPSTWAAAFRCLSEER